VRKKIRKDRKNRNRTKKKIHHQKKLFGAFPKKEINKIGQE